MIGTIQYNLQGNRFIHHQHIIHSSFSAQMMQGRNLMDYLSLLSLRIKHALKIRNFACCSPSLEYHSCVTSIDQKY